MCWVQLFTAKPAEDHKFSHLNPSVHWDAMAKTVRVQVHAIHFRLRLHGIGYVQIRLGSDPLCLHGTGSNLERYGST